MSFHLYSAIIDTQITFPIIGLSIGLFLINILLDPSFILVIQEYVPDLNLIIENRSIKYLAFWNELQVTSMYPE